MFTQQGLTTSSTVAEQNHCNYREEALLISCVHLLQLCDVFKWKLQLFFFHLLKKPPVCFKY